MKKSLFFESFFQDLVWDLNPIDNFENMCFSIDGGTQKFFNAIFAGILTVMAIVNLIFYSPVFLVNGLLKK